MSDLFGQAQAQTIALENADLTFWQEVDLGIQPQALLNELISGCEWRQDSVTLFGKTHPQPRLTAWYGDAAYRYSGLTLEPAPWTPRLRQIRDRVEQLTGHVFNSVLLNYYRDQQDCMGMHSDDEPELGPQPAIASLSLGARRDFRLKHRDRRDLDTVKLALPSGSLLLMAGDTQRHWRHGIARQRRHCDPRINLTFRQIVTAPGQESR